MAIQLKAVDFDWPGGHAVFQNLSFSFESQRKYGLVGPNGVGKSTLAQLILGELTPRAGQVRTEGRVAAFRQAESPPAETVAETLADLWLGLPASEQATAEALQAPLDFSASCRDLSGGEWTRVRLLRLLATGADFLLLDEPTNNLDSEARAAVRDFVRLTRRGLLLISHDRELLGEVDSILELSNQGLTVYGGNWSFYEETRRAERTRLAGNLERAKDEQAKARRERDEKLRAQEKRTRNAERNREKLGLPRILIGGRKRRAQETFGKLQVNASETVQAKLDAAQAAFAQLKAEPRIYADFPETSLPASKLVFEAADLNFQYAGADQPLWKRDLTFAMKGPERRALTGANGAGKTTFLHLLTGFAAPSGTLRGTLRRGDLSIGFVDQQTSLLDPNRTVFENVDASSTKGVAEVRNLLAQFLFPGSRADQPVATLSGGERLRAALAKVLVADPAPQLLILDEPTNNLDLLNLEFLAEALAKFEGALLVVSHDATFLADVGITEEIRLE